MATQFDLPIAGQMLVKQDAFMQLIDKALTEGANADVVGKMLDHYERWQKMQAKQAFDTAMQNLRSVMPKIVKRRLAKVPTKGGGEFTYPFANLEDCCETLDPHLLANGFSYSWNSPQGSEKGIFVACILKHKDGHSESATIGPAPMDNTGAKNPVQAVGSTMWYLQRYSFCAVLGIAPRSQDTDAGGFVPNKEMAGLDDWVTKIADAHDYQEMRESYDRAFAIAVEEKNQAAKDALIGARDAWRKRRGK
jgi:hypothetical protein